MSIIPSIWVYSIFLHIHCAFIVLIYNIVLNLVSLVFQNIINHILYGKYSLVPASSASVEILVLNFCLDDNSPLVWLLILGCTSYAASLHVYTYFKLYAPIVILLLMVILIHTITRLSFFWSYSFLFDTPIVKYETAVSMSDLSLSCILSLPKHH